MQVEDRQPSVVIDAKTYDRLALALLLVFGVVAAGRNFWIADDAFMYLRTALQYVQGNGLRFNAVERVQAFTSPSWMLVLANLYYPIRNVAALVFVASLLFWVASTMMIYFSLQRERRRILFIFVALYSTRLFTDYQTSGLETPLLFFTLVGFYFAVSGQKQWKEQILWISLVGVTRFDALLFCVPCIVLLAWKEKLFLPQKALQACLAGAPLALWCLFAIFYYGSILPSPAIAKLNHLIPTSVLLTQGVIYLVDLFQRDTAAAILIFTGIVAPWCAADSINRGIAAGVLLHLVYVVTIGGDFMQGRFFYGELCVSCLVLGTTLFVRLPKSSIVFFLVTIGAISRSVACPSFTSCDLMPERIVPNNGIADERVFWSASYSTVVWNQQTPFPAPRVNTFTRPSMRVELNNFPGSNGFLSSLNDVLVDAHGLTDGFLARIPFTAVGGTFRPGHLLRQVPPGYLDSVRFRAPKMLDDKLNEAYSLYELAVSGPLFSYERIKAAILLALGTTKENMHSFVEHPITVKQSWFTPVRRGTKWDNAAAIQLGSNGVLVLLDEVKLQKSIAFYADHNDRLRVKFGECDHETQVKIVEEVVSDPPYGGGLQPRNIIRTSATSFNCFLVVIDGDDSLSSIAYVTL